MTKRSSCGRALFYTRDSGGKHETTPAEYVAWAKGEANRLMVGFDGTPAVIEAMIRDGEASQGDVFLDYDVCGNLLSRKGLNLLFAEVDADKNVSHVLIPRRDRLARPDNPLDAVEMEMKLRRIGVTLVFMGRVFQPLAKGQRVGIEELLGGLIDYDHAGKDRTQLAEKIIYAQVSLAKDGYSTGGRPPFGFRRWLVKDDGTSVRQLEEGERVRMRGHHVVWLPGPDHEIDLIRRILDLLTTMPASRVAKLLTAEGVPSPDAGRTRTDNGVKHQTSGIWQSTTIINIARNSLLVAISSHGRRSMGDQLRYTSSGPRALTDGDFRTDGKPKVVRNPQESEVRTGAPFEPLVDQDKHSELVKILDQRGASQRGKPRSRDPSRNPLGSRIFDMSCGWPMYRTPYNKSFCYACGAYMQFQQCDHNRIDGPTATRFLVSCLRQKVLPPHMQEKLRSRLREMAHSEQSTGPQLTDVTSMQAELDKTNISLATAKRNMALASTPDQLAAMAEVFDELRQQQRKLAEELAKAHRSQVKYDAEGEVDAALSVLDRLPDLVANSENLSAVGEAFRLVDAKLFLQFQKVQAKKRLLNKLASGVVTFGNSPAPVPLYAGPTGRRAATTKNAAAFAAGPGGDSPLPNRPVSGREGKSLGNVSRENKTSFELFLGPFRTWKPTDWDLAQSCNS